MNEQTQPRRGNPAALLHEALEALTRQRADLPLSTGWATVLGIEPEDTAGLFVGLGYLHRLPGRVREAMAAHPDMRGESGLLVWEAPVEAALKGSYTLGNPIESVTRQYVTTGALASLAAISVMLKATAADLPSDEQIGDLLGQINDLEREVLAAEGLDHDLAAFLLAQINEMRQALIFVKVRGPEGLREAVERGVGAAWFAGPDRSKHPFGVRLLKCLGILAAFTQVGDSGIAIEEFVRHQIS